MKRIGLFGGTFDPVHREHIALAKSAIKALDLDLLIVIPAAVPPHKLDKKIASGKDRMAMTKRAFQWGKILVSNYELNQKGPSYSYLTCQHFRSLFPEAKLFFIMGADMFDNFSQWKNPDIITRNVILAVCRRGNPENYLARRHWDFIETYGVNYVEIPFNGAPVSSTKIRTLLALGEKPSDLPDKVLKYILDHKLYVRETLVEALALEKESRRAHSIRVALMAVEYAKKFGVDEEKALIAAGLHDCAKNLEADSPLLEGFDPPKDCPEPVLHQYAGAYVAEKHFGVEDEEILDAIRFHTSGRKDMTKLGKLIFLADMLEEGRDYPGVEELRELFNEDLDRCLKECLKRQLVHLKEVGGEIYPLTQETYDSLEGETI